MTTKTVPVALGERSYDIHIGRGLLTKACSFFPDDLKNRRIFIIADEAVTDHVARLEAVLDKTHTLYLQGGEQAKSWGGLKTVMDFLLDHKVDRGSILIAVGGGVIGDLGGFAAAIALRGIPFIQVPTTLLSQVDSSVGGKTGINSTHGKNLIGSFYQPRLVLCDMDTLDTLPDREMRAGYAEVVKYGLINDPDFFDWLGENGEKLLAREDEALSYAIETSCRAKAAIVSADEKESGQRALLNLGHTFGHALEAAAGYDGRLIHGEGVAIGMVLAHRLSEKMGLCGDNASAAVKAHLKNLNMPTEIADIKPALSQSAGEIVDLMYGDKKASNGKIGFIVTRGIGQTFQSKEIDMTIVKEIVAASMAKEQ